jgi:hypothetical protein
MNQKGRQSTKNVFQKWINIYVLPFQAMAIIASFFFHSYEYQGFFLKNSFDEILSLSFDLGPLKVNNNVSNKSQFCKGLSKRLI